MSWKNVVTNMEMKIRKFKKPVSTWAGHSGQWGSQAEQGLQLGFLALSLLYHSYPLATDLHKDDDDDDDEREGLYQFLKVSSRTSWSLSSSRTERCKWKREEPFWNMFVVIDNSKKLFHTHKKWVSKSEVCHDLPVKSCIKSELVVYPRPDDVKEIIDNLKKLFHTHKY